MKKLNSQKGIAPIIAIIVLAVVFVGVGISMLSAKKSQPMVQKVAIQSSPADATANWKTYTNSKYGVSINYPPDWHLNDVESEVNLSISSNVFSIYETVPANVRVDFIKNFQGDYCNGSSATKKNIIINGTSVEQIDCDGNPQALNYKIGTDNYWLMGVFVNEKNADTFKKMFSTFKFTDQKSPNLSKTSPDDLYDVSETMLGDYNTIIVKDSSGKVISNDLIKKNEKAIGYGTKFGCQCGTSFAGWTDGSHFILKIVNGNGEEYQYIVDASIGIVDESTFKRVK